MSVTPPAIVVEELRYRYPGGQVALDKVSFEIAPGESVGLVGPNGAGKTTFFLCLAGVLTRHSGRLQVAGLDPGEREQRRQLPAQVGIVFQNSDDQLISPTVLEDVAFGPLNLGLPVTEARQRAAAALERVGLAGFEERTPLHLSGGEKRRAALAGVLAMQPDILLLDEPSIHLDPRGRREFIKLINSLAVTKIIAAHDLELILQTCRRALVLDHGQLIADGPARTLLADAALMEAHGLEVPHSLSHHAEGNRHHDG
jgi:cobalt/nickel transport system ATP-binding protein